MSEDVLSKIRAALEKSPLAREEAANVSPDQGRLIERDLDREGLLALFKKRADSSGARVHHVGDGRGLRNVIEGILPYGTKVACSHRSRLAEKLGEEPSSLVPETCIFLDAKNLSKEVLFEIDAAITAAEGAVAETGSILLTAEEENARLVSLTAHIHIAILWPDQIRADLLDWTRELADEGGEQRPPGITLITGPSKTADIELKLVQGVHGPEQLHLILVG
ncbi:MAG: LutC/YkgG family protein [Planctomycetota bacterium]|jgi:L-lactate dehydrogenase complex protein LldG